MSLVLSRQLTHPNLVQLYGVCSAAPIYIVTEFMKHGKPLVQRRVTWDSALARSVVAMVIGIYCCLGD